MCNLLYMALFLFCCNIAMEDCPSEFPCAGMLLCQSCGADPSKALACLQRIIDGDMLYARRVSRHARIDFSTNITLNPLKNKAADALLDSLFLRDAEPVDLVSHLLDTHITVFVSR